MTDEIRRLLVDIMLLDSELNNAPSLEDMARRAKAELDRAALAPESGGPTITFDASEVEEVRALTGEWNNDLRRRVCEVVWRAMVQPPSSPSSAQPDPAALEVTERDRWAWRLGLRQGLETCLKEAQTRSPDVLIDVLREMLKNLDAKMASEGR